jgi:hypothetical protein
MKFFFVARNSAGGGPIKAPNAPIGAGFGLSRLLCDNCRRLLGGNAPEYHGRGLLNGFEARTQKIGIAMPELDVVCGCGSCFESQGLADHEGNGFRLSLADLLRRKGTAVATMQDLVSDLVRQRGELLGRLHPAKECDFAAMRQTFGRRNPF